MKFFKHFFNFRRTKRVYFVRHGETVQNAEHIRQGSDGALSELGRKQAAETGERLASFSFEIILSSPYERTHETAEIINSYFKKKKKIEPCDLLKERRNPSEIVGKWGNDPEVRKVVDLIDKSFHEGNLRYSDEENFEDLKLRAEKLLDFLSDRREREILCVTHHIFLEMVGARIEYGPKLTPQDYTKISFLYPMKNASITVCEYDPRQRKDGKGGWKIIAWNDYLRKPSRSLTKS